MLDDQLHLQTPTFIWLLLLSILSQLASHLLHSEQNRNSSSISADEPRIMGDGTHLSSKEVLDPEQSNHNSVDDMNQPSIELSLLSHDTDTVDEHHLPKRSRTDVSDQDMSPPYDVQPSLESSKVTDKATEKNKKKKSQSAAKQFIESISMLGDPSTRESTWSYFEEQPRKNTSSYKPYV